LLAQWINEFDFHTEVDFERFTHFVHFFCHVGVIGLMMHSLGNFVVRCLWPWCTGSFVLRSLIAKNRNTSCLNFLLTVSFNIIIIKRKRH
jgi:hypothetical protein